MSNSAKDRTRGITPHRFAPGVSGNPGGRPKGSTLRNEIIRIMAEEYPDDPQGRTWLQLFALTLVELAMQGHPQAIREVCGRFDGAIPQAIDLDDKRGRPVIQVNWGRSDGPSVNREKKSPKP